MKGPALLFALALFIVGCGPKCWIDRDHPDSPVGANDKHRHSASR